VYNWNVCLCHRTTINLFLIIPNRLEYGTRDCNNNFGTQYARDFSLKSSWKKLQIRIMIPVRNMLEVLFRRISLDSKKDMI